MSSVYTCVMGEGEGKKTQRENSVKHVQIHCSQQGKTIASSPVSSDLACVQITVSEKKYPKLPSTWLPSVIFTLVNA